MKKYAKKIVLLLCCLGLLAALTGCSTSAAAPAAPAAAPASDAGAAEASAETDWPKRTITIVTSDPGGDMDYMSRYLAQRMNADWGVNVVVTNIEGQPPVIRNINAADNDGYTLWVGKTSVCIEIANGGLDDIDVLENFDIIGNLVDNPALCVTVKPELGVSTFEELLAYTQEHPDELLVTDNIGSNTWVTNMLLERAGLQCTEVDVGGTAKKMTAFLGNQCDVMICSYPSQREYAEAGEFVVLGQVSEQRNPLYPEVPTLSEQGYDIVFDTSLFVGVKAGTDPAIEAKLKEYLKNIVENDEQVAKDAEEAQLMVPVWRDGEVVEEILSKQIETVKGML